MNEHECINAFKKYIQGESEWSNSVDVPRKAYVMDGIVILLILLIITMIPLGLILLLSNFIQGVIELMITLALIVVLIISNGSRSATCLKHEMARGIGNYSRTSLARLVFYLDHISNGCPDLGVFDNPDDRITHTNSVAHLETIKYDITRILPTEGKQWLDVIDAPFKRSFRLADKILIRLLGIGCVIGLGLFVFLSGGMILGVIPSLVVLTIMIQVCVVILVFCFVYMGFLFWDRNKLVERLKYNLNTTEIKEGTRNLLQSLIDILSKKIGCPMRVHIIGKYRFAYRTGRWIETSTGIKLYETFILPSTVLPPEQWVKD